MLNISKSFRETLKENFTFVLPSIQIVQKSTDGTRKFLLSLEDDNFIEMVLIPNEKKNTLCVSSQVGCKRKCTFCATAKMGLIRNLTVSEILGQVFIAINSLKESRLTNIVFMGMGEPLDNLENVIKAIKILQHENCLNFSPRKITVSTCGVIPGIKILADSGLKIKLAVSLNSAIEKNRNSLMPVNRKYPLNELKNALLEFRRKTSFRITFEYIMMKNFNMQREDVKAIKKFAGDISCKINLIPWNPVNSLSFTSPTEKDIEYFTSKLGSLSSVITLRNSRGQDIDAACGQLAGKSKDKTVLHNSL